MRAPKQHADNKRGGMFRNGSLVVICPILFVLCLGCSRSGNPSGPSGTQNRSPTVSISASATFGVAQLTTFTFNAAASDPDGDPLTVSWNFGDGTSSSGTTVTKTYLGGGTMSVLATASDNKGASTPSNTLAVAVGSMTGTWTGTIDLNLACLPGVTKSSTATFTQVGGSVTGAISLPQGICNFTPGTAITDPAEPGTISGSGAVRVRVKVPPFIDIYFQGQMDSTGRRVTGGLQGSGHTGTPFVWNKQ